MFMKTASRLLLCSLIAQGFVICAGCGDQKAAPKTYPVSIKIIYRGQGVEGANVSLIPQERSGSGASGVTDATGVAKVGIPGLVAGAIPDKYRVIVSKVEADHSDPNMSPEEFYKQQSSTPAAAPSSPKHLLPVKYLSPDGGLECTVTEQPDQVFEFTLAD
jgi:hypothetical protein